MARNWFEVDRAGLTAIAKRRGMGFIVTEPIQNAWDEDTSRVEVELHPVPRSPTATLVVRDDSPDGFRDLTESHTLFRESRKLANPEQRGRFNLGEKLLLAAAVEARVTSTTGSVIFGPKGRTTGRKKTSAGTVLEATLRMTRDEVEEALEITRQLIPPSGIVTVINGEELPARAAVRTTERVLDTEVRGEMGGFKYATRKTTVQVYEVQPGETPQLLEMGIPVDKVGCPWHVNVGQKVPLSMDRGSVRFGYTSRVQRMVAELMADRLTEQQSRDGWVSEALNGMEDEDAVREIVRRRFGKAVTYDPSDPEASKRALDAGFHVVRGGELSKGAWDAVRRAKALEPAGRRFNSMAQRSPDGVPPVPRAKWDGPMEKFAQYGYEFTEAILGHPMAVNFYHLAGESAMALCGQNEILINLDHPGGHQLIYGSSNDFEGFHGHQKAVDAVLIHECAHVEADDHLSDAFHRECTRIGAKLRDFYVEPYT